METYTFIKSTDSENYPNPILAISAEMEEMRVSDTYDNFGQKVSPADAGDYITLDTQKAVDIANKAYHDAYSEYDDNEVLNRFSIDDYISDYDYGDVFSTVIEDCEEDKDYEYHASTCKGFNYWDGRNWQSVVVEYEHDGNNNYEVIENDSLDYEIYSKEWIKDGFGKKIYQSENFWIIHNYRQGSFAEYELYAKVEYDLEDVI